jgi:hypothetical protein
MIDAIGSERHFVDHLLPIWLALPDESRGTFYSTVRRGGVPGLVFGNAPASKRPTLVSSVGDMRRALKAGRPTALMEHGAGQSYGGDRRGAANPSYAGGRGRDAHLFLFPGEHPAARERAARPDARVEVVGCPKLDSLPRKELNRAKPVICVSFHWDGRVCPETRSAATYFQMDVKDLARKYHVIGHGHPRIWPQLSRWFARKGIEPIEDFAEVCRRADVYVCDNSSTIFEFASTDRPVVLMNPPIYRRTVEHGLRFWDAATVGVQTKPKDSLCSTRLQDAVAEALLDSPEQQAAREAALDLVYAYRTGAAERAAAVLLDWAS